MSDATESKFISLAMIVFGAGLIFLVETKLSEAASLNSWVLDSAPELPKEEGRRIVN